jgi:hypothetical protein
MSNLKWDGNGSGAEIIDYSTSGTRWNTYLEVDEFKNVVHIRQDEDHIALTKREAEALVSYLNCVILTMKDFE